MSGASWNWEMCCSWTKQTTWHNMWMNSDVVLVDCEHVGLIMHYDYPNPNQGWKLCQRSLPCQRKKVLKKKEFWDIRQEIKNEKNCFEDNKDKYPLSLVSLLYLESKSWYIINHIWSKTWSLVHLSFLKLSYFPKKLNLLDSAWIHELKLE